MYRFIFGPVPSRRLGMSLGIDLVPRKVCSLDCVYCEVGLTTKLTTERMEYVPYQKVINELTSYLENHPAPDFITFSGYGEPTLNSRIGDVLKFIKENYPDLKVAVLTNGTLFSDKKVREELMDADVVLPSLDAATNSTFKKLNRPEKHLSVDDHINGLIQFRKEFKGKIWLEIFILPGYNDNAEELEALKNAIEKIQPHRVQLNTLDRPGAIEGLRAASNEELENIREKLGLENVKVVAAAATRQDSKAYRDDTEYAILETIARRPCTVYDLRNILGLHVNEINKYLDVLQANGKISTEIGERGIFYRIA
ncbi:radical SAM protein [Anaerophaga thermohalophila]|jgi:wyosine [tRNA(Phe)-imidazoG37] synthetase (radical SAM superfamily)|uniref:radical SAM protein n=1 Tax=Anaerophaga thermohalophila TaxID=177400 RepID=UPI00037E14FF|nr:radical SAM protein [Anaerophaga thermohalophila]